MLITQRSKNILPEVDMFIANGLVEREDPHFSKTIARIIQEEAKRS